MPPPPVRDTNPAASQTRQLAESIAEFSRSDSRPSGESPDDQRPSRDGLADTVRRFARDMQQKLAKLSGSRESARTDARASTPGAPAARNSLANVIDAYRPDRDVVAPISVRPNAMELLWVCGDCGQHYPRARECPEVCSACGAPKQHFFAPIED